MHKIHQGDVFKFLTNKGCFPELNKSELIEVLSDLNVASNTHAGQVISGTYPGLYIYRSSIKPEVFYEAICKKSRLKPDYKYLKKYKDSVRDAGATFDHCEGIKGDTLKSYLLRMFDEGLYNKPGVAKKPDEPRPNGVKEFIVSSDFIGREELMGKIKERLNKDGYVVLHGIGGIGKTELVKKYTNSHKNDYDYVIQAVFEEGKSFEDAVLSISFENLDEKDRQKNDMLEYRKNFLKNTKDKLLVIFDNADNEQLDLTLFKSFCENYGFHKIVTTRLPQKFKDYNPLEVTALTEDEQLELFKNLLTEKDLDEDDEAALREILKLINGHTKMIEIVAGVINEDATLCSDVAERLRQNAVDEDDGIVKGLRSLYNMAKLNDNEKCALHTLYILPEKGVRGNLLKRYLCKEYYPFITKLYNNKRWVEYKESTYYLHPIIRDLLKADNGTAYSYSMHKKTADALADALKNPKAKDYRKDLCRVCESVTQRLNFDGEMNDDVLRRFLSFADYCYEAHQFYAAKNICERLIALCEENQAVSDTEKNALFIKAGQARQRLADYPEAIEHYKKAIKFAKNDDALGKSYRSLGEVLRKASDLDGALENDLTALKHLTDPLKKAEALNAIGVVYINMANREQDSKKKSEYYNKCEEYYKEALEMRKNNNADKRDLAYSYHNLGTYYHRVGDYKKAAEYHKTALDIRLENQLDDSDIAASYALLGNDHTSLGNLETAENYINESLAIRERLYGKNHPDYAWGLMNLFYLQKEKGNKEAALQTIEQVIQIRRTRLGENHNYTKEAVAERDKLLKN